MYLKWFNYKVFQKCSKNWVTFQKCQYLGWGNGIPALSSGDTHWSIQESRVTMFASYFQKVQEKKCVCVIRVRGEKSNVTEGLQTWKQGEGQQGRITWLFQLFCRSGIVRLGKNTSSRQIKLYPLGICNWPFSDTLSSTLACHSHRQDLLGEGSPYADELLWGSNPVILLQPRLCRPTPRNQCSRPGAPWEQRLFLSSEATVESDIQQSLSVLNKWNRFPRYPVFLSISLSWGRCCLNSFTSK